LIEALATAYLMESKLDSNLYNLSFGKSHTVIQVLEKIQNLALQIKHTTSKIVKVDFPSDRYDIERRNARVSSKKFQKASNWKPRLNLEKGLQLSLIQYSKDHNND
jgi:dTDP-D-glucose 4,6-dehydratase